MKEQPHADELVSVVIPCHNQGCFLAEAVDSVLEQTHVATEIIVVNDGSTDDTSAVARSYRDRVTLIELENGGSATARNAGLDVVTGEWVQFLDADDVLLPDKVEACLAAAAGMPRPAVTYCDYYRCSEADTSSELPGGRLSPRMDTSRGLEDLAARWEGDLSIPIHSFLFHGSFFREQGLRFDASLLNHEDWEMWLRIMALRPQVVFVDRALVAYRRTPASKCRADPRVRGLGFCAAIEKQLRIHHRDPVLRPILLRKLAETRDRYGLTPPAVKTRRLLNAVCRHSVLWVRRVASVCGAGRLRRAMTRRPGARP